MKILTLSLSGVAAWLVTVTWQHGPQVQPLRSSRQTVGAPADDEIPYARIAAGARLDDCRQRQLLGRAWLQTVPGYTATFRKQERVGDELGDENTIELKLRHAPFSVRLRWLDEGRIVYYRDVENDNRMTVKMGGWKGRLGWINLDPESRLAMAEARHPVTTVGLQGLIDELLRQWEPYCRHSSGTSCEWLADEPVDGRPCQVFRVRYASPEIFQDYRESTVWLDAEHSVPLRVRNYDWYRDDPANPDGLVEHYIYENLDFGASLTEADFQVPGVASVDGAVGRPL